MTIKSNESGFLFPAFVHEYIGTEQQILSGLSDDFDILLKKAAEHSNSDLLNFNILTNNFLSDELKTQFITYIFSCSISNILKKNNVLPAYTAGYSMGLYAALYFCESVTFEDGLDLIQNAFDIITNPITKQKFGMGIVVGLDNDDLNNIIFNNFENIEIINENNKHTFVISGLFSEVKMLLEMAREEGALHTRLLSVTCPYHTKFMNEASNIFDEYLYKKKIYSPKFHIISLTDQKIITSEKEVRNMLVKNINSSINWHKTICKMLDLNIKTFVECGAGKTLYKIAKFIDGDFKIYPINRLKKFLSNI